MMRTACMAGLFFLLAISGAWPQGGHFEQAESLLQVMDYERAAEAFLSFAEAEPDDEKAPLALYTAGRVRLLVQQRPEDGSMILNRLIDSYSGNEWSFHGAMRLAEHALEAQDTVAAASLYDRAVTIGNEVFPPVTEAADAMFNALKKCGEIHLGLARYEKAEDCYAALLQSGITDRRAMPDIYLKTAACCEKTGNEARAAEIFIDLIRTYPDTRQACGLCGKKEQIRQYVPFDWSPFEYFAEGYHSIFTWPTRAADHFMNLQANGGSPELVRKALALLPWVYYYSFEFDKAEQAHADYLKRYAGETPELNVQLFPAYLESFREEFGYKKFLTSVSLLVTRQDAGSAITPQEEYVAVSRAGGWTELDLTPHFGFYNQLNYVDRPLDSLDQAFVRFSVSLERGRDATLEVDTDEPWGLWHNGVYLGSFSGTPGTARLTLRPEENEVMIRLAQKEGGMTSSFRFVDENGLTETDLVSQAVKR